MEKKMSKSPTWKDILELRIKLKETNLEYWLNDNLFIFSWWFLLITMIILYTFCWLILDKSRISEILLFGFIITIIVIILDVIGVSFMLWGYPTMLIPLVPPIFAFDLAHIPIFYMLVYQCFTKWKSFLMALTITALIFSFVFEPLVAWLGIYETHQWKSIYSVPIYIAIGVLVKWIVIKIKELESMKRVENE